MTLPIVLIALALGLAVGAASLLLYERMPEHWLRDYEPTPVPVAPLPTPRLPFLPFGPLPLLLCPALSLQAFSAYGASPVAVLCVLCLVPLSVVVIADFRTRIIPDQCLLALAVLGLLLWGTDHLAPWVGTAPGGLSEGAPWYLDAGNRLGGALAGGLFLLAVGWVGSRLAGGVEAMGMGDVKLLAVSGLLSGLVGLVPVLLVSFVTGAVFAVPALVRKYGRREAPPAPEDDGPEADAPEGDGSADAPPAADGTMPFGPFLVAGLVSVLFFGDLLHGIADWYLSRF